MQLNCGYPDCTFSCTNHRRFGNHIEEFHECPACGQNFADVNAHHCLIQGEDHQQFGSGEIDNTVFQLVSSAHNGVVETFEHNPEKSYVSISEMFVDLDKPIKKLLRILVRRNAGVKIQFKVLVDLFDIKKQLTKPNVWLSTGYVNIRHVNFIKGYVSYALAYLNNTLSIYNSNQSGYTLKTINKFQIIAAKYIPLYGGAYTPLPKGLRRKRGLLNIEATEFFCFHFCIVAAFHESDVIRLHKNKKRVLQSKEKVKCSKIELNKILSDCNSYMPFLKNFNFEGLHTPVRLNDLDTFEGNNDSISVNCFGFRGGKVVPLRTTEKEADKHVDLLLYRGEDKPHFLLIRDLSAFLGRKGKHKHIFCKYCLRRFLKKHALNNHLSTCVAKNKQTMTFPKDDFYEFKSMYETLQFPFVLYFDLETFNQETDYRDGENTFCTGKLEPAQYSLVLVGPDGFNCAKVYDGENVIENLIKTAEKMADKIRNYLKNTNFRNKLTPEQEKELIDATSCQFCGNEFTTKNIKVQHHSHHDGKHCAIICQKCNTRAKTQYIVPIISHNGTNFDHHLIMKGLTKKIAKKLTIVPQSNQNFLGFILNNKLKFMDSNKMMPGALSELAIALQKDGESQFEILFQYFRNIKEGEDFFKPNGSYTDEEIRLALGKQAFPYQVMTNRSCFELKKLPPIELFRNKLKLEDLKPEIYNHALLVWQTFNMKNFGQYSRFYCLIDTLILACVVESQRKAAFKEYNLELLHKWSMPGFSYSAGMFTSKARIQYMKDEAMVKQIRSSVRGGPCFVNTRFFQANNERIKNYDNTKERTHIFYSDLKSLYPSQLLNSVPTDSYKFLTPKELENIDVLSLPEDSGVGYIFEVDLIYDKSLHDWDNDLPCAPVKRTVTINDMSGKQMTILKEHSSIKNPHSLKVEKLILTLEDKESYVCYYKTLKFYLAHGLRIKGKIKNGIVFNEKPIFREYIANNLARREKEKSEIRRQVLKLVSNSFYGKMLQSYGKFNDVIFCRSRTHALHLIGKAEFLDFYHLTPDISIFIMKRKSYTESSLFFIGFVILELAKLRLYQVHYEGVKKVFKERCSIAYTDTDSAYYLIRDPSNTFIADLKALSWLFDYSNLGPSHELYDIRNVGQAGVFKLEELDIVEFCGLSAKLYSYTTNKNTGEKKAKGISTAVIKHKLTHEDFVRTVKDSTSFMYVDMDLIRSKNHQLYYQTVRKVALSALDLKRYLLSDGYNTLAHGHYRINEIQDNNSINNVFGLLP